MEVIKRDGKKEEFDINKIKNAVEKAYKSVEEKFTEEDWENIYDYINLNLVSKKINVEDIQNCVIDALIEHSPSDVIQSYIKYRESHSQARFIRERIDYMNKYSQSRENAATSSETDANANISIKNVANLEGEVYKTTNRIIQRQRMKIQLQKDYPEVAEQYEKDIINHIIYVHDESSTPVPKHYCMAVNMYPFLEKGTSTMDGLGTKPPHNLDSFCGQFVNLVFLNSSQCKGAVGYGEFFNFFDWACVQEWGENYYIKDSMIADSDIVVNKKTISQKIEQAFQSIVYSINQPAGNRGYQSPFINFNYFDKYYWKSLFGNYVFPDGSKPKWERVSYLQKKFMKWFNKERTKTLLTYPVESMCLLNDGKDYKDIEYKEFAAEMWAEGHSFFVYTSDNADSVASCCRLRNDIKLFTSTTGLTGIEIGSCNVITLNLNRIVQDWWRSAGNNKVRNYKGGGLRNYLLDIVNRVYKYQVSYKNILYDWENRGMITASNAGYIHMSKLYSTFGINGLNEAAMFFGLKVNNNEEYKNFCIYILETIKDFISEHNSKKYMLNLELVPAESLGVKNYNWDKEDNYEVPSDRNLYNSYIYDAHDPNISIFDKFTLQGGKIAKAVSGGQAIHCNLAEHLSKGQYIKLLDYAVRVGANYFTFNIPNTQCDDCGNIYKHPLVECPKCHSHNMTQWTRIIGFLRPIKAFSKERKVEESKRVYSKLNTEDLNA